jgi:hypothetical protein
MPGVTSRALAILKPVELEVQGGELQEKSTTVIRVMAELDGSLRGLPVQGLTALVEQGRLAPPANVNAARVPSCENRGE